MNVPNLLTGLRLLAAPVFVWFFLQGHHRAALAVFVAGVPLEIIQRGLMTFTPSASRTPGRLNVIETVRGLGYRLVDPGNAG